MSRGVLARRLRAADTASPAPAVSPHPFGRQFWLWYVPYLAAHIAVGRWLTPGQRLVFWLCWLAAAVGFGVVSYRRFALRHRQAQAARES